MTELSKQIIDIILSIPPGKVLSYGGVAILSGNPKAVRQVSWLLKSQTKIYNLPWFRVINSKGFISIKNSEGYILQKLLLESEGVIFDKDDKVDLKQFLWDGKIDKNL